MVEYSDMEYLTHEKKDELEMELNHLKTVRRKEVADALLYAKSLGDLSENAEYQQAREDQANCEERIAHIEQILKNAVIADKHHAGVVEVGTTVVLVKEGDKAERQFMIVGSEEADSQAGKISNESPIGKAILGKSKGDKVTVSAPKGEILYTIKSIA
ncbi:MAG: grea/greb family elongation factor, transcription elongation factor GreA [Candidatus Nomurabacteria bacterium]|nr:grea/greb family elongation factor, transcription elongation factor GreA [Candidatus Nomurabacteria bacterium]